MFIFTKIPHVFGKIVIFKTLFWPYFIKTMSSGSNWPSIQLIITDTDTDANAAKMWSVKTDSLIIGAFSVVLVTAITIFIILAC